MTPGVRKFALSVHLTFSVGWIGTVFAYLALGLTAANSSDVATMRGAWMAMELIGWYVIVPLAVASLLTGVLMALGTKWGLFQHYWVSISFFLTLFAVVVLILHMPTVSSTADVARAADAVVLRSLGGDLFHPAVGLVILLVVQVLNLYKPKGLTRYGWRKQRALGSSDPGTSLPAESR
ncbi:MAG TPA: DUF2269 domain-containing protein [Actinomycetota bacterium]|nr:DUF2269 domain-containing protein [Actinomycetota bacterium]